MSSRAEVVVSTEMSHRYIALAILTFNLELSTNNGECYSLEPFSRDETIDAFAFLKGIARPAATNVRTPSSHTLYQFCIFPKSPDV
jgi:hypothetical protein